MPQHLEHLSRKRLSLLYQALVAVALATALTLYFQSAFLKEIIGEKNIGIFFAATYVVAITAVFFFPSFLKKMGARFTVLGLLSVTLATLAILAFGTPVFQLFALALYEVMLVLLGVTLDIFLESFSKDNLTGRIRGKAYTFLNIAFVIAPSIAGTLASQFGFRALFLGAALVILPLLILFAFKFRFQEIPSNHQPPIAKIFCKILTTPALCRIFYISLRIKYFS